MKPKHKISEKGSVLAITAQTIVFVIAGWWLHGFASDDITSIIPILTGGNNVSQQIVFAGLCLIATIALLAIVNLGLYAVFIHTSEGFRIDDKEASLAMKELLYLDKPSSYISLFIAAFGEEMLFRYGMLCVIMSACLSAGINIEMTLVGSFIITSLVFGILHSQYSNILQFIMVFLGSCILCISYVVSGSIIVVWIAHFAANILAILIEPKIKDRMGYKYSPLKENDFKTKSNSNDEEV